MMKTALLDSGDTLLEVLLKTLNNNSSFGPYKALYKGKCLAENEAVGHSLSSSLPHLFFSHTHRISNCNPRENQITFKVAPPKSSQKLMAATRYFQLSNNVNHHFVIVDHLSFYYKRNFLLTFIKAMGLGGYFPSGFALKSLRIERNET